MIGCIFRTFMSKKVRVGKGAYRGPDGSQESLIVMKRAESGKIRTFRNSIVLVIDCE